MAIQGRISEAQREINQARDDLAAALRRALPDASYVQIEDVISEIERFINAKSHR